jgi:hypothetical protein
VIKLADDSGHAGLCLLQKIEAVAIAAEAVGLQLVDRAGEIATVSGVERADDIGTEHRRSTEGLLDGVRQALEDLGRGSRQS